MRKEPGYATADGGFAPKVLLPKQRLHLTGPVHGGGDLAHLGDAFCLALAVRARAIGGDIEARRLGFANGVEDLRGGVGAVEDEEEHCGLQWRRWREGVCHSVESNSLRRRVAAVVRLLKKRLISLDQ